MEETAETDSEYDIHTSDSSSQEENENILQVEPEEHRFNYSRLGNDLDSILASDSASTIQISKKFIILGTHGGMVHLLDFSGNKMKEFPLHNAVVNDLSLDESEEYFASASDDGTVTVTGVYSGISQKYQYTRAMKCVALSPDYGRKTKRQLVAGGMSGEIVMDEKGWFGDKRRIICSDEGAIFRLSLTRKFLAWANGEGVKLYDIQSNTPISFIPRTSCELRPDLFRCCFCWKDENTLMVGYGNEVQVASIRESPKEDFPLLSAITRTTDVIYKVQTEFAVCGVAPFGENIMMLSYNGEILHYEEVIPDEDGQQFSLPPEIRIFDPLTKQELVSDPITPAGYQDYQPNDYKMEFFSHDNLYFILSPKDIITAKPRDMDDHIEWLISNGKYQKALEVVSSCSNLPSPPQRYKKKDVGKLYLEDLFTKGEYDMAANLCAELFEDHLELWEEWVFRFSEAGKLQTIASIIPICNPTLNATVYEMVLGRFMNFDRKALLDTIQKWPTSIYNIKNVIDPIEDLLFTDSNDIFLMESAAELYFRSKAYEKALGYFLKLKHPKVFNLIALSNEVFDYLKDKIKLLMEFNHSIVEERLRKQTTSAPTIKDYVNGPGVQMLTSHLNIIPIRSVVQQLESSPLYLHIYLDAIFNLDKMKSFEFHELQVELYAEYDYENLLFFLKSSNFYNIDKAIEICRQRDLVQEMVYLYSKAKRNKEAISLIINREQNIQKALEFAKEQDEEDLWDVLMDCAIDKPEFIKIMLENAGMHINPEKIIHRIKDDLEIPGLKSSIIKVLHDYSTMMSLREGCQKILVDDSIELFTQLCKKQRRGFSSANISACALCNQIITFQENQQTISLYFCHHVVHSECVRKQTQESVNNRETFSGCLLCQLQISKQMG